MEILVKTLVNHLQSLPNVELKVNQTIKEIQFQENTQIEISTQSNEKYHIDHLISAL
ncbi:unnamed protein product, partial [Rotaria socialis]